jgi:iron complex outermembrane receptor protein
MVAMFLLAVLAAPSVVRGVDSSSLGQAGGVGGNPKQLKSLSLEQLGNIEVVTESKEPTEVWNTPAPIYVLTAEDIRRAGVTNVPDALRLIPGVNVARPNGSRNWVVGIRGLGDQYSRYVLVLIDGRDVFNPLFGGVLWPSTNVMIENIDRIEVIRGPGGTIWGSDAVNGIVNIITKPAQDTQGGLISAGGGNVDQDTEDLRYGWRKGDWSYRAGAFGFLRSPEYHVDGQPHYDWSRFGQVGFRTDRKVGPSELTFDGDGYWGKFGDAQMISNYVPPASYISYQSSNSSGGDVLGRWRRNLGTRADLYLQGFGWHDRRINSNFHEVRDTFDLDFLHRLWLGDRNRFAYGLGLRISPSRATQVVPTLTFTPLDRTDSIYSAFLQDDLHLLPDKAELIFGSKLEHNNYTGFEYQPNGRLLFTPAPATSLWASVSRAVRIPDRLDEDVQADTFGFAPPPLFARLEGNHNLRAERLTAYEAGARTLLRSRIYLDFAAFNNDYRDLIAQGPATPAAAPTPPFPPSSLLLVFQYKNGIHGNTDGAEIAPDWQAAQWWRIRTGYSYLHLLLEDQPGFTDTKTLTSLHGSSPNDQAFLQSQIDLPRHFNFDHEIRYVGALPAQNVPAYVTADARFGRHLSPALDVSVVGQNLLQPHHAEFGITPAPNVEIKRGIYAKLVWTSK